MNATFSVKNFQRFQHYKDRSPPWIKLYNELLDDYAFGLLRDASKMHLVAIWLLASRSDNEIPYDPTWIAKRINATEEVNLDALVEAGFIVVNQPRSRLLAKRKRTAMPETETETETETEAERDDAAASSATHEASDERSHANGLERPAEPVHQAARTPGGRGARLAPDWGPSVASIALAIKLGLDTDSELEQFRGYWCALPGAKALKLDWDLTFQNRLRDVAGRRNGLAGKGSGGAGQRPTSIAEAARDVDRAIAERGV